MFITRTPKVNGLCCERESADKTFFDHGVTSIRQAIGHTGDRLVGRPGRFVRAVDGWARHFEGLDAPALQAERRELGQRLRREGLQHAHVCRAFALIREQSRRTLGMFHHHTQVRSSYVMLRGQVAEMATGEGKTLAATLAAATAALAGVPVHIVTANDYLATRDAATMQPLYEAMGLSCGSIAHDMDLEQRRAAYGKDIVYCSNSELVFDYLKDQILLGDTQGILGLCKREVANDSRPLPLLLRGLHFAIVDEIDSVLVDDARTPLIISGEETFGEAEHALIEQAMRLADRMVEGEDFRLDDEQVRLQPPAYLKLGMYADEVGGLWRNMDYAKQLCRQALASRCRYLSGRDYIVDDEQKVQIVDQITGRVMEGRSWGQGLHQMIEAKEGVPLTSPRETLAEIGYQTFFRKYQSLSGMTGTAREVRRELLHIFSLPTKNIPLLKRSARRVGCRRVLPRVGDKFQFIAQLVEDSRASGRPVLIGTADVTSSEALSQLFAGRGIEHQLLNARFDAQEADIIARAGQRGAVTIATSMAGRGTDIKLDDDARRAGGLHVVIAELQDASRIDRQLAGRSGRQGDPGMVSYVLSAEDRILENLPSGVPVALLRRALQAGLLPERVMFAAMRLAQKRLERRHFRQRMRLLRQDRERKRQLAFVGRSRH